MYIVAAYLVSLQYAYYFIPIVPYSPLIYMQYPYKGA